MHKLPNLLKSRHGVFYLRATLAGRQIKRSLGTKDWDRAKILALTIHLRAAMSDQKATLADILRQSPGLAEVIRGVHPDLLRQYEVDLATGKVKADGAEDHARALEAIAAMSRIGPLERVVYEATQPAAPGPVSIKTQPWSVVTAEYLKEAERANVENTVRDKKATYARFEELFGDLPFGEIGSEHMRAFKTRLLADKKAPRRGALASPVGGPRINSKLSYMRHLFDWAIANGHRMPPNPWDDIKVGSADKDDKDRESREPFNQEELDKIFDPTTYAGYGSAPHYYWIPFLALYTGARVEEIASLRLSCFKTEEGIEFFEPFKAKNSRSKKRKIPLHDAILKSRFMLYLQDMRKQQQTQLFPGLSDGKNGFSKNISRRFNEVYLPELGIKSRNKSFGSFRPTFITRMAELQRHPAMIMALVGHYEQTKVDLSSPHFQNYQGAKLITALKDTIDAFDVKLPIEF